MPQEPEAALATSLVFYDLLVPKRRKKTFRVVDAVKALARERVGAPKASRIIVEKKKKSEKHKPKLQDLLEET